LLQAIENQEETMNLCRTLLLGTALTLAFTAGCGTGSDQPVPEYTIEQFMDVTYYYGSSFSHDASQVLVTSDASGVFNAYACDLESGQWQQMTFSDSDAVLGPAFFPYDERVLFRSDVGGNEIYHLYVRDTAGAVRDITPYEGVRAEFYGWSHDGQSLFLGLNQRNPQVMDIYEMAIAGLTPDLVYQNDSIYDLGAVSPNKRYLALQRTHTEHNTDIYIYDRDTQVLKLITEHEGDVYNVPADFSADSEFLYFLTNADSEFDYLARRNLGTGQVEVVERADWNVMYAFDSHQGRFLVTAINNDGMTELHILDNTTGQRLELPVFPDGNITSASISRSEELIAFYASGSRSPRNLYIMNLGTRDYQKLTDALTPEIDSDHLVDGQVVRYTSFDGIEIPAILYKPHHVSAGHKAPAGWAGPGWLRIIDSVSGQSWLCCYRRQQSRQLRLR
jgi:Tol biopolymer transport system component